MKKKRILPPTFFMIAIVLIVITHLILPLLKFIYFPWNLLGLPFMALGGILNLLADKDFKRFNTTVKPFEYSTKLVTNGIFSLSRNPMYVGMVIFLLGESILFGSLFSFLITIIFMFLMYYIFIKVEENMLLEIFGSEYSEYKNKVRRWI
jgi:protein-S-isoprenylcysteine O-methyltransferase Ste14